jgi:hypothetical protein
MFTSSPNVALPVMKRGSSLRVTRLPRMLMGEDPTCPRNGLARAPVRTIARPMEQLIDDLTFGNVYAVKTALASVAAALAVYQLVLIAIGYGKVRPAFLTSRTASFTHRASGDVILVLVVVVALACLAHFGFDDHGGLHEVTGFALLAVLGLKIAVIRWWHGLGRFLPVLGTCVFVLLALTWLTSAGHFLAGGE